jgi:adenosine deaminase
MSIESFIRAMPKAELHVHLEGAFLKETLVNIADENDARANLKHFDTWLKLLDNPDYTRLDQISRTVSQWLQYGEDLTRLVYDLGVALSKQNVRYAEVSFTPTLYSHMSLTLESMVEALNDGRDRVQRGWGVRMAWILTLPRDDPRKAEELIRFAGTLSAKRAGVVAIGLAGRENAQPPAQFERAFKSAEKKDVMRVLHGGDVFGVEGTLDTLVMLRPNRLIEGVGAADAPDTIQMLVDNHIPLDICMARALCMNEAESYAAIPLRQYINAGVSVLLSTDMPSYLKTTLSNEYIAAVEHAGITIDELQEVALNAVRAALLPNETKQALFAEFTQEYSSLSAEHLQPA